jgi:hypothetical protein
MLHFEEALRLEPDHRAAREYLHQVTARRAKSAGPKPF